MSGIFVMRATKRGPLAASVLQLATWLTGLGRDLNWAFDQSMSLLIGQEVVKRSTRDLVLQFRIEAAPLW